MKISVYYCSFDKPEDSHRLLKQAAIRYLMEKTQQSVDQLGIAVNDFHVSKDTEHGKPYFEGEFSKIHFSISHSDQIWACAFGEQEIGLDVQKEVQKDYERLAGRFFHREEVTWLQRHGFHHFCRMWAYKESYVKYTGDGLSQGLDHFSVIASDGSLGAEVVSQMERKLPEHYWMVVTAGGPMELQIKELF